MQIHLIFKHNRHHLTRTRRALPLKPVAACAPAMFASWWNVGPSPSVNATEPHLSVLDNEHEASNTTAANTTALRNQHEAGTTTDAIVLDANPSLRIDLGNSLDELHDMPPHTDPNPSQSLQTAPDPAESPQNGPDPDKALPNVTVNSPLRNVPYKPKHAAGSKTKDSTYYEK
jgi:hypothetical protein